MAGDVIVVEVSAIPGQATGQVVPRRRGGWLSRRIIRRDAHAEGALVIVAVEVIAGQRAMAVALAYPETEKGGRGKKGLRGGEVSSGRLSMARLVLRDRDAEAKRAMSVAMLYPEPAKTAPGKQAPATAFLGKDVPETTLSKARAVLRYSAAEAKRAMSWAVTGPEPAKGGRGNKLLPEEGVSSGSLSKARAVLRYSAAEAKRAMSWAVTGPEPAKLKRAMFPEETSGAGGGSAKLTESTSLGFDKALLSRARAVLRFMSVAEKCGGISQP